MPAKVIKVKAERPGGFQPEQSPRESYTISLNDPESNAARGFPNNYIRTTKYTLLTFLPKNLFEQFRRISNFYFLIVVIIQLIPQITPLIPITSILPLAFVLAVTALKEAVEDFYRHRADKKNNTEKFKVLRYGILEKIYSQDIKTGDIVLVENNKHFPADMIVLSTALDDGTCFVKTANLDGETNLKLRKALPVTTSYRTVEALNELRGIIQCESPNEKLYQFNGRLVLTNDKQMYSLNHSQLLHRGAQLKNTNWIYGFVVYAGKDTKLYLNQQPPPSKFSTVERQLNRFILGIFIFQMFICLVNAILSGFFEDSTAGGMPYLGDNPYSIPIYGLRNFFTYFVLFNTMIPISLWVTLELVKVGQAKFMEWDRHMGLDPKDYNHPREKGMNAKTSNLNEDLGRIEHIFSDKTGTLTENLMNFNKCSIQGKIYDERRANGSIAAALKESLNSSDSSQSSQEFENSEESPSAMLKSFLEIMSLCHTVVPEPGHDGEIVYQSQSPDETALVETARDNGYTFLKRTDKEIVLEEHGEEVKYKMLAILEFTSARRRMSVIVENSEGRILLLSKGADIVIYERLREGDDKLKDVTTEHLREFSKDGLRTLVFAKKELTRQEFEDWKTIYNAALTSIENREERVEAACEIIETELQLLGCTAIEDKLQDQVPETIHYLLEAGIQLWVLTGDRQETAINIGYSSRLLTPEMELIIINAENSDICGEQLRSSIQRYCVNYDDDVLAEHLSVEEPKELGMVIDGHSLGFALHDHTEAFLQLGKACRSVICCRVTPLQKALVVRVVKQGENRISCAVGDGANDVSMIQEAHVGIGIFGKEGTHAARASDYAIHQFKHLKRLLCVHGRYSYIRITGIIQYSFYKNMMFSLAMLYYSFYNGFTGQTIYDSWIITFYNIVFTSLPPLLYGLFEKDLNEDIIFKHPQVYKRMQEGVLFTKKTFLVWLLCSVVHSIIIFYFMKFLFENDVIGPNGLIADLWTMGTIAATMAIFIVNLKMALETKHWNLLIHIAIWGSIITYVVTLLIYSAFVDVEPNNMYYIIYFILSKPSFYISMLLIGVMALLPDFMAQYLARQYWPEDWQILRERYRMKDAVVQF